MKIEYRVAGAVGAYAVLYDETAGQVSKTYKASFKDKVEVTPGFGSPSVGTSPNANTEVSLEIPLSVPYSTPTAASAGVRNYRSTLKGLRVNLKVTIGTDVGYWPSAVLANMTVDFTGSAVDYVFLFTTQDLTGVEPN